MNVAYAPDWNDDLITCERIPNGYRREYPMDFSCTYDQMKAEAAAKARQYLADIRALNPQPVVKMHRIQEKIQLHMQEENP